MKIFWQPTHVFSRYLFAYLTSNQVAKTLTQVVFNIMTNNANLPTTLMSDKGSAFVSHVIEEVAGVVTFYSKARHYKPRKSNWVAWTISRVNQTSIKGWKKRAKVIVAYIR